jgi:protein translocase SEC61 complex gamma subunit
MLGEIRVKLASFLGQCRRIFTIATKPNKKDYLDLAKIVAAGVGLIGLVGFIIYLIFNLGLFRA